jgi:tetratricopeptide (TPR) repeat protein
MEILIVTLRQVFHSLIKKMVLSLILLLAAVQLIYAQDQVANAFKQSYALEKAGNFKGAIDQIKAVYQADSYEINLRLGWLSYQASQLKESIDYYNLSVNLKPYAIEPKLGLVLPLSVQGKWTAVEDVYLKILQIDPQNSLVNYRLGLIYYNRRDFEKADPFLEKVVNLYPFDYDGLLLLAWNKFQLKKSREATVLFQKVLLSSPGDASALEGLTLLK